MRASPSTIEPMPALTGLRGVAAVWVFLFHLGGSDHALLAHGYLGVDVFFILSGFILSHVYAERLRGAGAGAYLRFLQVRLARIYPLHLFALLLALLLVVGLPGFAARYPDPERRFSAAAFVASLLLLQNWAYWLPTSWNSPSWSLSAEWLAYLGFPFLVPQLWRIGARGTALALGAGCLAVLALALMARGVGTLNLAGSPGMLRLLCEFSAGCFLYRGFQLGARADWPGASLAAVALVAAALAADWPALAPFGFALLILAAASPGTAAGALLARPSVVLAGELSFSLYMLHWLVIQLANWAMAEAPPVPEAWTMAGTAVVTAAVAYASWRWIEQPARAWGRRLGAARAAAPG